MIANVRKQANRALAILTDKSARISTENGTFDPKGIDVLEGWYFPPVQHDSVVDIEVPDNEESDE